jgi:putative nucleotidyltransferase with HDIG domain
MMSTTTKVPATELPLDDLIAGAAEAEQFGAWDEALAGYRSALDRIHEGEQPERGPQVSRWIGRVLYERGDYEQAHRAFEASLVDAQALGRRGDAASALNSMAVVEQARGNLDVAESLYARATSLADEAGNARLAAMIDQNLGTLANIRGDLGTALVRYQAALDRFRQFEDHRSAALVLHNMGMLKTDLGEWAAAELCFESAENLADWLGDRSILAKVDTNRAELYLKRQNYEAARECCERAFKASGELGSETGLGEAHKFFGVLNREIGKPRLAHSHLGLALNLARSCENPLLEAETENERAKLFLSQKQAQPAIRSLNRAQEIFRDLDARREILDLRRRLERLEGVYVEAALMAADEVASPVAVRTGRRGQRVCDMAAELASSIGYEELLWIRVGALLHDIGNGGVPKQLLEKAGPLSEEEMLEVRKHPELGDALARDLDLPPEVREVVRSHHEHWDGSGYPDGLGGEQIPLSARIVCVADVFDALTSQRSYRPAFTHEQALEIMEAESGRIFDPKLFDAFASSMRGTDAAAA